MCDYSLYAFSNRLARDGEELVAYRFSSGCTGLICVADVTEQRCRTGWLDRNWPQLKTWFLPRWHEGPEAVCVPPGARLALDRVEGELRSLGLGESEEAVFTQATANEFSFRDGLRFRNGCQVLLQSVPLGQRVRIISTAGLQEKNDEIAFAEVSAHD